MKLAIVGANGMVGRKMLDVLDEQNIKVHELYLVASEKSIGKELKFRGENFKIQSIESALNAKPDAALFSAGASVSEVWAPKFAECGTTVIDNSSAWRMYENIKLIVPEINGGILTKNDKIIANPNCSTIQLVLVLNPLHKQYRIKRVVVSTYQSVSGSGKKGIDQLMKERAGEKVDRCYPHQIDMNCLPHGGDFLENGYTKEEMKLLDESRKILGIPNLNLTSTVVRVPVIGGHSESVNIEFENDFDINDLKELLQGTTGVTLQDDPSQFLYPMPITAHDKDDVFVGRIRRDICQPNALNLWVVSDNLRKGAATNAVQILDFLVNNKLI